MRKGTVSASILAKVKLPSVERVTSEVIERRRIVFSRVIRLREEIGPIGIPTDELIRRVRAEEIEPER